MLNSNQLIRRPDLLDFKRYVLSNKFLETLLDLARKPPPDTVDFEDLQTLRDDGFRYVIVHRRVPSDQQHLAGDVVPADLLIEPQMSLLRQTLGSPRVESPWGWVFELPSTPVELATPTWSDLDVVDLPLAIDVRKYGLPVSLKSGQTAALFEGKAERLCFWANPRTAPDDLLIGMRSTEEGEDANTSTSPLELFAGHWSWIEIDLPKDTEVEVFLTTKAKQASAEITRAQVIGGTP
jgi:hypothetical protein